MTTHSRSAFTLLELVISVLLTSILMVALVAILRSATQTQRQSDHTVRAAAPTDMLREQIERDCNNARGLLAKRNEIVLYGYLGQDAGGLPDYRPEYVGYRIVPSGLLRWRSASPALHRGGTQQLVWAGAASMELQSWIVEDEYEATQSALHEAGGLPVARGTSTCIVVSSTGQPILDFNVSHGEGP